MHNRESGWSNLKIRLRDYKIVLVSSAPMRVHTCVCAGAWYSVVRTVHFLHTLFGYDYDICIIKINDVIRL